ncbi:MAG: DUF4827 domain-containing protein [Bacteroidales bacterium]|nr:DUF4827 domain-containing protein [Bacteroidales bacterium]
MNLKLKMLLLSLVAVTIGATSCSNNKSYAEQLADERVAVNLFLAGQRVVNDIPADTIFETGSNAPYYRIDEDGNVYMQVLSNTGLDARPKTDDVVYFRYMRYNVITWCVNNGDAAKVGNMDDMKNPSTYFLYDNYTVETSVQYGQGIQMPLQFVGVGSEVNLIIKSQKGLTDEVADVNPYHWHVRYYKSKM